MLDLRRPRPYAGNRLIGTRQRMRILLHLAATGSLVSALAVASLADDAPSATPANPAAILASHTVFPRDNPWNTDISQELVDPKSDDYIAAVGKDKPLHPDFGPGTNGIPFQFADHATPRYTVKFDYPDESDQGPLPHPRPSAHRRRPRRHRRRPPPPRHRPGKLDALRNLAGRETAPTAAGTAAAAPSST